MCLNWSWFSVLVVVELSDLVKSLLTLLYFYLLFSHGTMDIDIKLIRDKDTAPDNSLIVGFHLYSLGFCFGSDIQISEVSKSLNV